MLTETFADQAFNPVAIDRSFESLLGNRQPQACLCFSSLTNPYTQTLNKYTLTARFTLTENTLEFRWSGQPIFARERSHACTILGNQTLTALGTTRVQYFTTICCFHPRTETVGTRTTQVAGLKGSFHDNLPTDYFKLRMAVLRIIPVRKAAREKGSKR